MVPGHAARGPGRHVRRAPAGRRSPACPPGRGVNSPAGSGRTATPAFRPQRVGGPGDEAAWSAISRTPVPGDDPGAGSLAAQHSSTPWRRRSRGTRYGHGRGDRRGPARRRWGASAVPLAWRRILHGWPGLRGRDLIILALCSAATASPGQTGGLAAACSTTPPAEIPVRSPSTRTTAWCCSAASMPCGSLRRVDAVVSLCRLGSAEAGAGCGSRRSRRSWLTTAPGPGATPTSTWCLPRPLTRSRHFALRDGPCWFTAPMRSADAGGRRPLRRATPRYPRAPGTPRRTRRLVRRTAQPSVHGRPRPARRGRLCPQKRAAAQGRAGRTRAEGGTIDRHPNVFCPTSGRCP